MKWSWRIARLAGVDVFLHGTVLLLIGWILVSYVALGRSWLAAASGLAFLCAVFACVVAHELGHALAARRFGIPTEDVTLYPIGGVARLRRIPEHPYQEFVIAVAGPLVNLGIAALLGIGIAATSGLQAVAGPDLSAGFLTNLLWANVVLVAFNLIPAFPMDGGRMLRAGLACVMTYPRATRIAAGVGQFLAIVLAIVGLVVLNNPLLLLIAFFIYVSAASEAQMSEVRAALRGALVHDAMVTRFRALRPDDLLHDASRELLAGKQQDFPVVEAGRLLGMLSRSDLTKGLATGSLDATVREAMRSDVPTTAPSDPLDVAMGRMEGKHSMPVLSPHGELVGLLDAENIGELMMIRTAMVGVVARSGDPLAPPPGEEDRVPNQRPEPTLSA